MAKKAKVQKKFTNLIIIDASGSMSSKVEEVKGGIRKLFEDIKNDTTKNPDVIQTTIVVDFSTAGDFRILVNSDKSADLIDNVAGNYTTRSMTALYDAIGKAFQLVPEKQDGVFVTVITDGEENDSKEFTPESVKKIIQEAKDKKWALVFMGCDEASMLTAHNLGFSRGSTAKVSNSGDGLAQSFKMSADSRGIYYTSTVSNLPVDLENLVSTSDKTNS